MRTGEPVTSSRPAIGSPWESARTAFARARRALTAAAVGELCHRVRLTCPEAASAVVAFDDIDECLYLAAVHGPHGEQLEPGGPLLAETVLRPVLTDLHLPDLATVAGVVHDPATLSWTVALAR